MYDIITIGAATRDVFLLSKEFQLIRSNEFSTGMGECVALGAKITVEDCVLSTGGGATNAAVTFANLGFQTAVVTRVGDDEPGRDVITELERCKVNTGLVKTVKKGRTGYSTLLTAPNGERTVLVYRGVSSAFAQADIPWKTLDTSWLYITSLGGNVELLQKIIITAKKTGIRIAANPGHGELEKTAQVRPLLKDIDILIVNLEEAQLLTGSSSKDGKILSGLLVGSTQPKPTLPTPLLPKPVKTETPAGTRIAIVTDGARGAYAAYGKSRYYAKNRSIKAISRTGAGDAFGSGFVAAIVKGMGVEEALKIGTLNAENVIQHIGAKKGILHQWPNKKSLEEIRVFGGGMHV